jgi:hypothetical protein
VEAGGPPADDTGMEEVTRIVDTDETSLEERVTGVLQRVGAACTVRRFTYWYTGRDAVHEAIVARSAAA